MTEGTDAYNGLAVPLNGNFEITAQSTSHDVMTLTNYATTAGDFIVCQTQNGTEMLVVEDDGKMTIGGEGLTVTSGGLTVTAGGMTVTAGDLTVTAGDLVVGDGYYLRFSSMALTTIPSTSALAIGDFGPYEHATNTYAFYYKSAANAIWHVDLA